MDSRILPYARKWETRYDSGFTTLDEYRLLFTYVFCITKLTKLRDFQYRLL